MTPMRRSGSDKHINADDIAKGQPLRSIFWDSDGSIQTSESARASLQAMQDSMKDSVPWRDAADALIQYILLHAPDHTNLNDLPELLKESGWAPGKTEDIVRALKTAWQIRMLDMIVFHTNDADEISEMLATMISKGYVRYGDEAIRVSQEPGIELAEEKF